MQTRTGTFSILLLLSSFYCEHQTKKDLFARLMRPQDTYHCGATHLECTATRCIALQDTCGYHHRARHLERTATRCIALQDTCVYHAHLQLRVRECVRASVRACVRACARACVRVCVRVCVRACVRACVCVSSRACFVLAHERACVRACVHA